MSKDRDVDNPTVPASGQTQGTSDGGDGTTPGLPDDQPDAPRQEDTSPYSGTGGGHSRGGEVF